MTHREIKTFLDGSNRKNHTVVDIGTSTFITSTHETSNGVAYIKNHTFQKQEMLDWFLAYWSEEQAEKDLDAPYSLFNCQF